MIGLVFGYTCHYLKMNWLKTKLNYQIAHKNIKIHNMTRSIIISNKFQTQNTRDHIMWMIWKFFAPNRDSYLLEEGLRGVGSSRSSTSSSAPIQIVIFRFVYRFPLPGEMSYFFLLTFPIPSNSTRLTFLFTFSFHILPYLIPFIYTIISHSSPCWKDQWFPLAFCTKELFDSVFRIQTSCSLAIFTAVEMLWRRPSYCIWKLFPYFPGILLILYWISCRFLILYDGEFGWITRTSTKVFSWGFKRLFP